MKNLAIPTVETYLLISFAAQVAAKATGAGKTTKFREVNISKATLVIGVKSAEVVGIVVFWCLVLLVLIHPLPVVSIPFSTS